MIYMRPIKKPGSATAHRTGQPTNRNRIYIYVNRVKYMVVYIHIDFKNRMGFY